MVYRDDMLVVWPDDSWCYFEDLEEFLQFHSDDYEIIDINSTRAKALLGE